MTSKTRNRRYLLATTATAVLISLAASPLWAGDNIEVATGGQTVISHKLWTDAAFPLEWRLHEDGVINNDALGNGTPAISNAAAEAEISAAFQQWEDIPTSGITVSYGGTTAVGDSGCDLVNVVTWSDTVETFSATTIAKGVTTSYVGPDLVLNAANRTVECGEAGATVTLPASTYPNGSTLEAGTILDMDMTWNPVNFDYVTTPNATGSVLDIRAVATHEFGHMFGFSHTSLAYGGSDPVTMFPIVSSSNVTLQNNMRTLEADDEASSGRGYPDSGFYPGGSAPFSTGAVSGRVTQPGGGGLGGVRVWAFDTADTSQPVYETFTATSFDWDPGLQPGDYLLDGLAPGEYFLCIVDWGNGVPTASASNQDRYNLTTINGAGAAGFPTECYDDAQSGAAAPSFSAQDLIRPVTVTAGRTTPNIDFVTGAQTSDFMLVMDRSGSMSLASGTPGKSKLEALQDAANAFIDYLDLSGGHRLGLVQFEETLVPLTPVFDLQGLDSTSVSDAHDAIDTMSTGGWTNIIGGVDEAIDQLTTVASPSPRQIVLVFSDGKHNRPVGSDLNDIHDPVVNNDLTLYSVGFGTSVDDAILSQVAVDSGGVHVNEQALDVLALGKHFLSIAASAADETTLVDPRYSLAPNETAKLAVGVTPADRYLTFAVTWESRNAKQVEVRVATPGGCRILTERPPGAVSVRRGPTHQLVKIPLPLACRQGKEHAGRWTISATLRGDAPEEVQILVFGRSPLRLWGEPLQSRRGPLVTARLMNGSRSLPARKIWGEVLLPLPSTDDSGRQDAYGSEGPGQQSPPKVPPRQERTVRFQLYDDGTHGDRRARDGLYTGTLPLDAPGVYAIRLVAEGQYREAPFTREHTSGFYWDGKRIVSAPVAKPQKTLRDRY